MAQYKVIQDIEAEDKLVGPLTLRQLIYAGIAALSLYICFLSYTKGAPFLIAFFLPLALGAGFFGFPWKGEQPTEIWALARLRFMLKPRVRIWDQDGVKDLVTVIAPKKLSNIRRSSKADMSQSEVRSRLKALADTIDSRGWATRNAAYGIYNQQWQHTAVTPAAGLGNPLAAMIPNEDMFDENNPVAQNFDAMLNKSEVKKRQRVLEQMAEAQTPGTAMQSVNYQPAGQLPTPIMPAALSSMSAPVPTPAYGAPLQSTTASNTAQQQPPADYWFTSGPAYPVNPVQAAQPAPATALPVLPPPDANYHIESDIPLATAAVPTAEELNMSEAIRQQNESAMAINYGHMRVLQPPTANPYGNDNGVPINYQNSSYMPTGQTSSYQAIPTDQGMQPEAVTRTPDPAILELANNDDLDIATIARQANKENGKSPDEVEIRLH